MADQLQGPGRNKVEGVPHGEWSQVGEEVSDALRPANAAGGTHTGDRGGTDVVRKPDRPSATVNAITIDSGRDRRERSNDTTTASKASTADC